MTPDRFEQATPSYKIRVAKRRVTIDFYVHDPSWDVGEDALYAARLSTLRGSESGFAMMRVAGEGC
jgi:hypothetical protein